MKCLVCGFGDFVRVGAFRFAGQCILQLLYSLWGLLRNPAACFWCVLRHHVQATLLLPRSAVHRASVSHGRWTDEDVAASMKCLVCGFGDFVRVGAFRFAGQCILQLLYSLWGLLRNPAACFWCVLRHHVQATLLLPRSAVHRASVSHGRWTDEDVAASMKCLVCGFGDFVRVGAFRFAGQCILQLLYSLWGLLRNPAACFWCVLRHHVQATLLLPRSSVHRASVSHGRWTDEDVAASMKCLVCGFGDFVRVGAFRFAGQCILQLLYSLWGLLRNPAACFWCVLRHHVQATLLLPRSAVHRASVSHGRWTDEDVAASMKCLVCGFGDFVRVGAFRFAGQCILQLLYSLWGLLRNPAACFWCVLRHHVQATLLLPRSAVHRASVSHGRWTDEDVAASMKCLVCGFGDFVRVGAFRFAGQCILQLLYSLWGLLRNPAACFWCVLRHHVQATLLLPRSSVHRASVSHGRWIERRKDKRVEV